MNDTPETNDGQNEEELDAQIEASVEAEDEQAIEEELQEELFDEEDEDEEDDGMPRELWQTVVREAGLAAVMTFSPDFGQTWFHFNADGVMTEGKHPQAPEIVDPIIILDEEVNFDWTPEQWETWYADWVEREGLLGRGQTPA